MTTDFLRPKSGSYNAEIQSWDVPALLTDPNDLAIFKAAEILWVELAGTGDPEAH